MPVDPRWHRIQQLIASVETLPAPSRAAWLAAREPDPSLCAEVLDLLAAMEAESSAPRCGTAPEAPAGLPASIGPYRVTARIGAGGRGVVYAAQREVAGGVQSVAIKVLPDHLITPASLDRFQREQRILAGLNHPAICRFLDTGWDSSGRPYLVLEWIDGVPIDLHCQRLDLSTEDRVRLMATTLDALHAAHQCLVVHLDLKPSNILIDPHGHPRLIDFGTAKLLPEDTASTSTRQLTPRYASPEQLRGDLVSTASDLYSGALTLAELVAPGAAGAAHSSLAALAERAAGVPFAPPLPGQPDLEAVLGKALQPDPRERYRSAAEFADDLRALVAGRPVTARRPTALYRFSRFLARHRRATAGAIGAAVLLAGLGLYAVTEQRRRLAESRRSAEIGRFLLWMVESSATAVAGRPQLTVLEMVSRANQRIEDGLGPPDDVAALLQANFAYVARESGREEVALPLAQAAVTRADRAGNRESRILARQTLAGIALRLGRCAEVTALFREADALLAAGGREIPDFLAAAYLQGRAEARMRCESDPAGAVSLLEQALGRAAGLRAEQTTIAPAALRASLHNLRALALARVRRFPEARDAVEAGLGEAAAHPDGRYLAVALLRIRAQVESGAGQPAAAVDALRQAAAAAPGVVNHFEELRLQTLIAGKLAEAGDMAAAGQQIEAALAAARGRKAEAGPSYWMLLADGAEVQARRGSCAESAALYREVDGLTGGQIPNDWRGNRLFFEAECAAPTAPARARTLARQALETYGALLPADSARARRLRDLAATAPAKPPASASRP